MVTINLPRIGYLAENEQDFFDRLDNIMDLAKQSLIIKREVIENLTESGLHPYSRRTEVPATRSQPGRGCHHSLYRE